VATAIGLAAAGCGGEGDATQAFDAPEPDEIAELRAPEPGALEVLARGQDRPCGVAVDEESVYWTNYGSDTMHGGSVMKMPLGGGAAAELASGLGNPCAIALDAAGVYWTSYGPDSTGAVYRVAKSGGGVYALATHLDDPGSIEIRDRRAYWTNGAEGSVQTASVDGGDTITLADGQAGLAGIALDANRAYWGAQGLLMQAPLSGGNATKLLAADRGSRGVAAGAAGVFWITDDGSIVRVDSDRSRPTEIVSGSDDPGDVFHIAVDASTVYWSDAASGTVSMIPADGGDVIELASDQHEPMALAITVQAIYWANAGDGTVVRARARRAERAR
jgi:hypothetical protein